ncbi:MULTISPECIES: hypothetical protein [unclassified Exiguobacterium]|uniref:hypothetical protein n=1 Tax=unclassified Exiguobacterium TaxID=2644629 RepID=UPI001BE5179F|nr:MULTISPECIES: hypothetical protein [unclassified Exiguobacterium]
MNLEQVTKMYDTYAQKIGDRKQVYETIADTFDVKQALYPGSHVDVAPSLMSSMSTVSKGQFVSSSKLKRYRS